MMDLDIGSTPEPVLGQADSTFSGGRLGSSCEF
jgi:hypothetical protein